MTTDTNHDGAPARPDRDDSAALDSAALGRLPLLFLAVGRGRVGTTTFLNALAQHYRERGADLRVWDAARHNESRALSIFHADAERPTGTDAEDVDGWIEGRIRHQMRLGYDAVLDLEGGTALTRQLLRLESSIPAPGPGGVRVVVIHLVGPDRADLDLLRRMLREGWLAAHGMVILLNDGLVPHGRSLGDAFDGILSDPAVQEAKRRGALVLRLPALPCMTEVSERALPFRAAAAGDAGSGDDPLSFLDQTRIAIWWEEEMPQLLSRIPPLCVPAAGEASQ